MANINKITVNGTTYDIEDTTARSGTGLTNDIKQALLDCFEHVAWIDQDGQDYYDALEEALYPPANLVSISCVYTQSGTVYTTDSLDSLKADLVVTAHFDDSSTRTVTTYTLSGTLTVGTSTITVSYSGKTTTFTVTVTANTATSISAVYTQSGTVYDTDSLDELKADLVVTATYANSDTATLSSSDYTLSGTLSGGTSTITVSYEGLTTTFNVTVHQSDNLINLNALSTDSFPDGAGGTSGNWCATDYIEVTPSTTYYHNFSRYIDNNGTTEYNQKIYRYNSSKGYLGVGAIQGNQPHGTMNAYAVPSDTYYVRIRFRVENEHPYFGESGEL